MLIAEHSMCQPGRPSPIGVVPRRLARLGALPEGEVADVVLAVVVGRDPLARPGLLGVELRQRPYAGHDAMRKKIEPSSVR